MTRRAARPIHEPPPTGEWRCHPSRGLEGDTQMAIFATFARRRPGDQTPGKGLPGGRRGGIPMRFEAVGEALVSGLDVVPACAVAGRALAEDGASLDEALSGLATTYAQVDCGMPGFEETRALTVAWSETSLRYLHQLSCADPLTGLTSLAHVRTRLAELYREAELTGSRVRASHALVVVELVNDPEPWSVTQRLTRTLRLATLADAIRHVFPGEETLGRLGLDRAAVLTRRTEHLGRSVATLEQYLADRELGARARVWIEGLPDTDDAVAHLLDDLARG